MGEKLRKIILLLLLLILPWVSFLCGLIFKIYNVWYFVLSLSWIILGLIFYIILEE